MLLCLQWRKELELCIRTFSKSSVRLLKLFARYPFLNLSSAVNQCEHKHRFLQVVVRVEQIKYGKACKQIAGTPSNAEVLHTIISKYQVDIIFSP